MNLHSSPVPADGWIIRLFVSAGHNYFGHYGREPGRHDMVEQTEVRCVAGHGLVGDRYFHDEPAAKGQITFFAQEVHELLLATLPGATRCPSALRRNVITRGLDLNVLIGAEFVLQGIHFLGTEECRPCEWMDRALCDGAHRFLRGRGGLRARILSDGSLRVGRATLPASRGT